MKRGTTSHDIAAPRATVAEEVVEPRFRKLSRRRALTLLALAIACLMVVLALEILVKDDRSPLGTFDLWGRAAEEWADGHPTIVGPLRIIEVGFATVGMVVWTGLVVLTVASRRRYRAAAFAVVTVVVTSFATTGMKAWGGRERPRWQDATDLLTSGSFPSGHASSSAALAGILIILGWSFLHRRTLCWAVTALAAVLWIVVCLDRVLLGRHYPTDVVAGSFLGAAVVLLGIVVFDPARIRIETPDAEGDGPKR